MAQTVNNGGNPASYDALAETHPARGVIGNDNLRAIAHGLLRGLKQNASVDWVAPRLGADPERVYWTGASCANMGIRRDLQDAALDLQQTAGLSAGWNTT